MLRLKTATRGQVYLIKSKITWFKKIPDEYFGCIPTVGFGFNGDY